ncbi:uncharacterized protein [Diadema antillarum]|uniref:uncharacterized protein n=1 Tax=Diadema antillarum TaxID=105358 RepID=UPI003A864795
MLKQDMPSGKVLLSFESSPRNKSRYSTLAVKTEEPEAEEAKEYAAFLKEQERKCGPDGFLDSTKYTHSFQVRGKVLESKGSRSKKGKPGPVGGMAGQKSPSPTKSAPASLGPLGEQMGPKKPETVVDVMNKVARDEQEHTRRMKIIEDHMWQHRQEERDLKRAEGDLMKNQTLLKRTMRDYEIAISRKKQSEDQKMLDNHKKEFLITRDYVHQKESQTKQNIEKGVSKQQQLKDEDRKVFLSIGDLERKYRAKVDEIELRRVEVQKLSEEFSKKMLLKEEETHRLNSELTDLALNINMELKKNQTMVKDTRQDHLDEGNEAWRHENQMERKYEQKIKKNRDKIDTFENAKRKLSLDQAIARTGMEEKIRDEGRALLDTRNRLTDNSFTQKRLQEEALNTRLDLTNKRIERKLQLHNARKQKKLQQISMDKRDQHEASVAKWAERYNKKYFDAMRRENEDTMKHAQRTVSKLEEIEHNLSNRVRDSELSRKQKEQSVRRLNQKLADMKRHHQQLLKQQMIECTNKERELEQALLREQSYLAKAHVNREEGYLTLQKHRMSMQEDVNILGETAREHQRLLRIGQRSDLMNSVP